MCATTVPVRLRKTGDRRMSCACDQAILALEQLPQGPGGTCQGTCGQGPGGSGA